MCDDTRDGLVNYNIGARLDHELCKWAGTSRRFTDAPGEFGTRTDQLEHLRFLLGGCQHGARGFCHQWQKLSLLGSQGRHDEPGLSSLMIYASGM